MQLQGTEDRYLLNYITNIVMYVVLVLHWYTVFSLLITAQKPDNIHIER